MDLYVGDLFVQLEKGGSGGVWGLWGPVENQNVERNFALFLFQQSKVSVVMLKSQSTDDKEVQIPNVLHSTRSRGHVRWPFGGGRWDGGRQCNGNVIWKHRPGPRQPATSAWFRLGYVIFDWATPRVAAERNLSSTS